LPSEKTADREYVAQEAVAALINALKEGGLTIGRADMWRCAVPVKSLRHASVSSGYGLPGVYWGDACQCRYVLPAFQRGM
jgi:hypothetical protein